MEKINSRRILLGGALTGLIYKAGELVFGGILLRQQVEDALIEVGGRTPAAPALLLQSLSVGILIGVVAVWLYAMLRAQGARRPGFQAGALVWLLSGFVPAHQFLMVALFPPMLVLAGMLASLPVIIMATSIGGWIYDQPGKLSTSTARA